MEDGRDLQLPPFDEWATVSISDSESDDDSARIAVVRTLEEEVREREIEALSKRLEHTALQQLAMAPPPPLNDLPLPQGDHSNLIDALRKFIPRMDEQVELYEEYAVMKHIGERLRN